MFLKHVTLFIPLKTILKKKIIHHIINHRGIKVTKAMPQHWSRKCMLQKKKTLTLIPLNKNAFKKGTKQMKARTHLETNIRVSKGK